MADDYIGVTAIVGDEGSGKSTMALTFPYPTFHFEIDFGGFDRAVWYIKKNVNPDLKVLRIGADEDVVGKDLSGYDIITKPYPKPMQVNKLMGQLTSMTPSTRQLQQPKKVEGMKELWQALITDFVVVCQLPYINTMIMDSGTALWNIAHNSRLQELQEIQLYKWAGEHKNTPFSENEYRERLQPIEYGQPNDRMTTLINTGRSTRKNMILTHYPTDEYGAVSDGKGGITEGKTGKKVIDGFKHTAKLCDLVMWTQLKEKSVAGKTTYYPVAKIQKCGIVGMGMNAVGQEIAANYNALVGLRNLMGGGVDA